MPNREGLRDLYQVGRGTYNMSPLLKPTGWQVWTRETIGTNKAWGFNFKDGREFYESVIIQ